jgi:hypothetical protein
MKPVCVPCRRFFRMKKMGFYFIEGMPIGNRVPPGNAAPEMWKPYKLWTGDKWVCEGCGAEILSGFGREPISEHYKPDFAEIAESLGANQLQVNDC